MAEKQGIATLSQADRTKVESLRATIKDLESQLANTIGLYVGLTGARVADWEADKQAGAAKLAIRVVGDASSSAAADAKPPLCIIYMDPPGICYPC